MSLSVVLIVAGLCAPPETGGCGSEAPAAAASSPEERALAFLVEEVPAWRRDHACFSCHNNGDAARALYRLRSLRHSVPDEALAVTTAWLARPERWKDNHGDERFSDQTLANIQFAAALVAARRAGVIDDQDALVRAAELLARDQQADGTWKIEAGGTVGSPITYGRFLTAALCRDVFAQAGNERFAEPLARIDRLLRSDQPRTVLDAAGCLLGLGDAADAAAVRQRRHCLEVIRAAEAEGGGWGPYRNAPLEPFDTAVVVLALSELPDGSRREGVTGMLGRGREYLIRTQLPDGSWPETTRPPDRESYAHRLSTTGWATLALVAGEAENTDEKR